MKSSRGAVDVFVLIAVVGVKGLSTPRYSLRESPKEWIQAEFNCQALGMSLVKIDTMAEYDDILHVVNIMKAWSHRINAVLIGLKYFGPESGSGSFHWTDGTELASNLTCWKYNQPDLGGGHKCLMLNLSDTDYPCRLQTTPCDRVHTYVCEDMKYFSTAPSLIPKNAYPKAEVKVATMGRLVRPGPGKVYTSFKSEDGALSTLGFFHTSQKKRITIYEDCLVYCMSYPACKRVAFEEGSNRACHLYNL